jgi:hypothetical protein
MLEETESSVPYVEPSALASDMVLSIIHQNNNYNYYYYWNNGFKAYYRRKIYAIFCYIVPP